MGLWSHGGSSGAARTSGCRLARSTEELGAATHVPQPLRSTASTSAAGRSVGSEPDPVVGEQQREAALGAGHLDRHGGGVSVTKDVAERLGHQLAKLLRLEKLLLK